MRKTILLLILFSGVSLSQSPSWITTPGDVNFSEWTSSSADIYRPIAFTGAENNELLSINISTGWASITRYFAKISDGYGWWPIWSNNGNGWLNSSANGWHIGSTDTYVVIENPGNVSYVLSLVRSGGWAMLNRPEWNGSSYYWSQPWGNGGNGWIGGWHVDPNDNYISGNFYSGSSQDEVFFMNPNGYAALNYYSGGSWINAWGNGGNGSLNGQWTISSSDKYFAFDYDGNGVDELLCVNAVNSIAKLLSNNGSAWITIWSSTNGYISTRAINAGGEYRTNKFKETGNCDQLVILNNSSPYYASLHEFNTGSGWNELWNNNGSQSITSSNWSMNYGDAYVAPSRYLIAVNTSTATSMGFNGYPNTPQNLSVSTTVQKKPILNWTASTEPDVINYQYGIEIWKRVFDGYNWNAYSQIGSLSGNSYTYTDNTITNAGQGSKIAEYKIRTVDNSGLPSPFTAPVQISFGIFLDKWPNPHNQLQIPSTIILNQNHPNPFNPTTSISYGIPFDSRVKLSVYDVLGREIGILVDEIKSAGYHDIQYDASQLPSGIYVYRLEAGNYTITKKMVLQK